MPQKRKELKIEGANLWYLVGLITTDGNLSFDGRHIDITSKDFKFLEGVRNLIGLERKVKLANKCLDSYEGWTQSKTVNCEFS